MQQLLSHLAIAFLARFDIQGEHTTRPEWKFYHKNAHHYTDLISRASLRSILEEVEILLPPGFQGRATICSLAMVFQHLPSSHARETVSSPDKCEKLLSTLGFLRIKRKHGDSFL